MPIVIELKIREYKAFDKEQAARLFDEFQDYLAAMDSFGLLKRPAGFGAKYLELTLKSISRGKGKMFVVLREGSLIGLIVAIVLPKTKDPGVKHGLRGRISELYLDKSHRGSGVGALLMKAGERYLKQRKCKRIFIEVFTPNVGAHKFYKKFGYRDVDFEMVKNL